MLRHPRLGALAVRLQDVAPVVLITREEAVSGLRLRPPVAGPGDACRGSLCETLDEPDRSAVAALVPQIDSLKFLVCPVHGAQKKYMKVVSMTGT